MPSPCCGGSAPLTAEIALGAVAVCAALAMALQDGNGSTAYPDRRRQTGLPLPNMDRCKKWPPALISITST
jgi:hypothetical protein